MSKQSKMITRRLFEEMESQGNLDVADDIFASDFVNHTPFGEMHGPEGAKQFVSKLRTAFPDLQVTVEDQIAEGDKVATHWTARGTHKAKFQNIPPTGKQIEIRGIVISQIANGKIVEQWGNPDVLGLMQQLGTVPAPEPG
jgi:steroid delta-isomerase-like uncharacterized protein